MSVGHRCRSKSQNLNFKLLEILGYRSKFRHGCGDSTYKNFYRQNYILIHKNYKDLLILLNVAQIFFKKKLNIETSHSWTLLLRRPFIYYD